MKGFQIAIAVGGIVLASVGGTLALTNPSQSTYEAFALEQLTLYLKGNACTQLPSGLDFLQDRCKSLVLSLIDTGRPQLKQLIIKNTDRQNFIFFSVYRTDLTPPPPLPSYHFETIGVFQNFYIYQSDRL
jgi:Domain of unknown function (DUF4359)